MTFVENILLKNTYIAPAERNAINIFSKELSLTKSKLFRNGHEAVKNRKFKLQIERAA